MKYTKYEVGPYNIHVINTDKFKTINIRTIFKRKVVKEEITKRNMLSDILTRTTKKYPTERDMAIESEELYDLWYRSNITLSGLYSLLMFDIAFLNTKYTDENIIDKSVEFLSEILFNPNVENNAFTKETFEMSKTFIGDVIDSIEENTNRYSRIRMLEEMDKEAVFSYRSDGYKEDLDKITSQELYEYYLSVLKSDNVDVFVVGNVDENNIKNIITKHFKVNTIKKAMGTHYIKHNNYRKRAKNTIERKDINQSKLVMGYKLMDLDEFETNYVSTIYSIILGGGVDSNLFKTVREKNSLCYSISSNIYKVSNLMFITSGIDSEQFKKAVTLIKKEVKNMGSGKFTEEDIEKAKCIYKNSCEELVDSPIDIINAYSANVYLNIDLLDERIKKIDAVTKEMVMEFSKKVKLDTIYLLEGGSNDEENSDE